MHAHRDSPKTGRFAALTAGNANRVVDFVGAEVVMIEGLASPSRRARWTRSS